MKNTLPVEFTSSGWWRKREKIKNRRGKWKSWRGFFILATTIHSTAEIFVRKYRSSCLEYFKRCTFGFFFFFIFLSRKWLSKDENLVKPRNLFRSKVKPSTVIQALEATNCPRLYIFWSVRRRPKLESPLPTAPRPFAASLCSALAATFL